MAKISEKTNERTFTLDVTEQELQFIVRALYKDDTRDDENGDLYFALSQFMQDNGVGRL